jgi:hypothetical protein
MIYKINNPFTGTSEGFTSLEEAKTRYMEICKNVILIHGPKITRGTLVEDPTYSGSINKAPARNITQKSFYKWLNISLNEFNDDDVIASTEGHVLPEEIDFYKDLEKRKLQSFIEDRSAYLDHIKYAEVGFEESDQYKLMTEELDNAKEHLDVITQNMQVALSLASEDVIRAAGIE